MRQHGILSAALVVGGIILTPARVWAQQAPGPNRYDYGPHMPMMGWGGSWYGMILGPLCMILVIALAVALVRWLGGPWQGTQPPSHHPQPGSTALDILKKRYARGEIDKAEFEERRRVLDE
jgi:putative membrane protein